jgi:hypothetical protein
VTFLMSRKPDAGAVTIENFRSSLVLIFKNLTGKSKYDFSMDELNTFTPQQMTECIINAKKSNAYVRTMLCAVKAYTGDTEVTKLITATSNAEREIAKIPEATEAIKEHHMSQEELDAKYEELKAIADPLWNSTSLDTDFQKVQDFVMYCLVCGKFIAPRRTQDWITMKLGNIDLDKDNHIEGRTFVFHQYKTSKHLGTQIIDIPPELYRIIRKWVRFNKLEDMFVGSDFKPMNASVYAKHLNTIMGGKDSHGKSTNNFRHIYLTNKYSNLLDLSEDMENMGSSEKAAHHYIKKV